MASHWVGHVVRDTPAPADGVALSSPTILDVSAGQYWRRHDPCPFVECGRHRGIWIIGTTHVAKARRRCRDPAQCHRSDRNVQRLGFGQNSRRVDFVVSDPRFRCPLRRWKISRSASMCPAKSRRAFGVTGRYARQFNYLSPPGDFTAMEVMFASRVVDDWFFLSGIDVLAPPDVGGIVALGDSITDGNISTHDAFCRWPDQLARRLHRAAAAGRWA